MKRIEKDFLGELEIPADALYGIHSLRAFHNFITSSEKHDSAFLRAYLLVKKACILAASYCHLLEKQKAEKIIQAIDFLLENEKILLENIIVPVSQGGAGTSLNMNINEVIANQALILMGLKPGQYEVIHPNDHINCCQSTNDTYPTALKIACIWRIRDLTEMVCELQNILQEKEKQFQSVIKVGRTEMQDALPISLGAVFGTWAEAISRDRWRLYKAEERLRVCNLGGTAIGTSVNAPRNFIFSAYENLRLLSGVGIAKAENLVEATSNQDLFLEAFSWVKILATNLYKMAQDIRYLSSSPVNEIQLKPVQAGSSIMPGKTNPVIMEMLIQVCIEVINNERIITDAVMNGNEQLNPWLPLISKYFLSSVKHLTEAIPITIHRCLVSIKANTEKCYEHLTKSSQIITALNPILGYEKTAELVKKSIEKNIKIEQLLEEENILTKEEREKYLNALSLVRQYDSYTQS